MTDKNTYALNDDALDQVIGGVSDLYGRTLDENTAAAANSAFKSVLGTNNSGSSGITEGAKIASKQLQP